MKCKWISKDNHIKCINDSDESGYCLMHKINKTSKENKQLIDYIKQKKINELIGIVFEEEFKANEVIKYKYDKLVFKDIVFMDNANFRDFEFRNEVIFENVKFLGGVSFVNSKFFNSCKFKNIHFSKMSSSNKIFLDTLFIGQNLELIQIENLARLDGIKFDGHTKIIVKDVEYKKDYFINGKINYRIARNQANKIGDSERIGYYYYKERHYGSKSMNKKDYPTYEHYLSSKFFDTISKYVIGYGEKPWNILIVTILTISIFAFLYMFTGIKDINSNEIKIIDLSNLNIYNTSEIFKIYSDAWYFSMIVFSTVGFGDIIAINDIGKFIVVVEVFFGLTIAATWTSVIMKRMIK